MTLNEYAKEARRTAIYQGVGTFRGVIYNSLKLCGEAGEIADKIGKIFGKGIEPTADQIQDLKKEAGDVLWHLTNFCIDLNLLLEDVADTNVNKLRSRQERGVLMAEGGDNR